MTPIANPALSGPATSLTASVLAAHRGGKIHSGASTAVQSVADLVIAYTPAYVEGVCR